MAPPWTVLLIGGNSGAGKTTVAPKIANHYSAASGQADDFRITLQRAIPPAENPVLHFFTRDDAVWQYSPQTLCDALVAVGEYVSWALEIVIASHIVTGVPIVLEGDGLTPKLASQGQFAGVEAANQVRSIFIVEDDPGTINESMRARGRGFQHLAEDQRKTQVQTSLLYGRWIAREARSYSLPVIPARPRETLFERVLERTG